MAKDSAGEIASVELSDLSDEERAEFGAIAGALIGLGMEGDEEGLEAGALAGAEAAEDGILGDEAVWSIADVIPTGTTAAVALLEHRWAIPLRDAIRRAGGIPLADTWVHPEDLDRGRSRDGRRELSSGPVSSRYAARSCVPVADPRGYLPTR